MNRGSCCTLKFFLPFFFKTFSKVSQMLKVVQELVRQILLLSNGFPTRVSLFKTNFGLKRLQMIYMVPNMSSRISMPSFMPCTTSLLSQLLRCLEINYIRSKVNCDQYTINLQDFWSTSTFWSDIHHLIKVWSWFFKESPQIIKSQELTN